MLVVPGSHQPTLARVAPPRRPRQLTILHPALAGRYTALVAAVAGQVEASTSASVVANRVVAASIEPPRLVLRPWRVERAVFGRRLARLARRAPWLLFTDVRECYRSIHAGVVEPSLVAAGCEPSAAEAVAAFLEKLAGRDVVGLPVGPEPSAVLANAVLARVDRALASVGRPHLRWVDDVVVAVDGPVGAAAVIDLIRPALGELGLGLNDAKTRVVADPAPATLLASVSVARSALEVG